MSVENMGRREYDGRMTNDHELLVRIDERLTIHLAAHAQFLQQYARDQATTNQRLLTLEDERRERIGSDRANARFLAVLVGASSLLTGVAVKLAERFIA